MLPKSIVFVDHESEDIFFGFLDIASLKRVLLRDKIVKAAAKRPRIRVRTEVCALVDELRRRVVNVARKIWLLE